MGSELAFPVIAYAKNSERRLRNQLLGSANQCFGTKTDADTAR